MSKRRKTTKRKGFFGFAGGKTNYIERGKSEMLGIGLGIAGSALALMLRNKLPQVKPLMLGIAGVAGAVFIENSYAKSISRAVAGFGFAIFIAESIMGSEVAKKQAENVGLLGCNCDIKGLLGGGYDDNMGASFNGDDAPFYGDDAPFYGTMPQMPYDMTNKIELPPYADSFDDVGSWSAISNNPYKPILQGEGSDMQITDGVGFGDDLSFMGI